MYGLNVATRTEVEQRNVIWAIMHKFVGEQMQIVELITNSFFYVDDKPVESRKLC